MQLVVYPMMQTSEGQLTAIVKQHYANVAGGHVEHDREILSDNVVHKSAVAGTITGIEPFLAFVAGFKQAFPDLHYEMHEFVEDSDMVAAEGVFLGTNTGPMAGPGGSMPPTGKAVELPFCDIWKVRDGRIVENRIYYDQIAFLGQLGLTPPTPRGRTEK